MKSANVSYAVAIVIGVVQKLLLGLLWAYIAIYNPLPRWLVHKGITGTSYYVAVDLADLAINVVLCLPAAYVLCKLRPRNLHVYVPLAVAPGFIWQFWGPLVGVPLGVPWTAFIPGMLLALFTLPIAVFFVRRQSVSA